MRMKGIKVRMEKAYINPTIASIEKETKSLEDRLHKFQEKKKKAIRCTLVRCKKCRRKSRVYGHGSLSRINFMSGHIHAHAGIIGRIPRRDAVISYALGAMKKIICTIIRKQTRSLHWFVPRAFRKKMCFMKCEPSRVTSSI